MSGWLNLCQFIGNVGRDPETRFQKDGGSVARITVAVNEVWKDKNGDKQERATWVPVVCFGKLGDIVAEYVKKGDQVYVQGRFSSRKYEKDGVDKWTTEIIGDKVLFLNPSGKKERSEGNPEPSSRKVEGGKTGGKFDDMEDDIPF